jgi:hypothetical protein
MDADDLELSSSPPTDADLWARLQAGEAKALATIYDRYAGLVYAIALRAQTNCLIRWSILIRFLTCDGRSERTS